MRIGQMNILLGAAAVFALTTAWVGGAGAGDDAKKDLKAFQGTWKAIAVRNADGNPAPDSDLEQTRLTVDGNKFTLKNKDLTIKGTIKLNPIETPKAIDVTLINDDGKETKLLGVYEIKGDVRKSCFALPQRDRPSRFTTEAGYISFEWKRE